MRNRKNASNRALVVASWGFGVLVASTATTAAVGAVPGFGPLGGNPGPVVEVTPDAWCDSVRVEADEDIARIVVRLDGEDQTFVLGSGISAWEFQIDGLSDVWVQTDRDDDGRGKHFDVAPCTVGVASG